MKLIKVMGLLVLFVTFGSCDNDKKENEEVVVEGKEMEDPDVVFTDWTDAWNSGNAETVRGMIADDAVLVMNGSEVPRDSIAGWVEASAAGMRNLKQNSLHKNNSGTMAYDTGNFSHGVKDNDTLEYHGTYTFIYEKPEGSDQWKAVVMDISDEDPMKPEDQ